jgi:hypothetical protein
MATAQRRRGRPPGSAVRHPDFYSEVWITVRLFLIRSRIGTGKTPSITQACMGIIAQGGMISAVGGNVESLVAANNQKKKRRSRFEINSTGAALEPSATGSIFASESITNARSLQNRYNEANRIANSDRRVRLAWMNLCRQRLGWPPKRAWGPGLRG